MIEIKSSSTTIKIVGNIRGVEDLNEIRRSIESIKLSSKSKLSIEVVDSFAMPSAMIGYLMKLVQQDEIDLTLKIGDSRLIELLDDLGLKEIFNIKKMRELAC